MTQTDPFANPALRGENNDFDENIVSFDSGIVTADMLFDLSQELKASGYESLGNRIEIEHSHSVNHDDYIPMFTKDELTQIVMTLVVARIVREKYGETDRVELIETFGEAFVDEIRDDIVVPSDSGPLRRVEVLDESDEIRIFDVLVGEQPVKFSDKSLENARQGVDI